MGNRIAAIDVGSNTIRSIIVEGDSNGTFRILDDEKAAVRLGEGLSLTGTLAAGACERAREALLRMQKIIDGYDVNQVEAVATSAVRSARNGPEFIEAMKADVGLDIRTISGEEEAELALLSARHSFDISGARYALLDIGGGSVEIVTAMSDHVESIYSLELGTVRMKEGFIHSDPISEEQFRKLKTHIKGLLKVRLKEKGFSPQWIIGSGGTITTIGHMIKSMRGDKYDSIHGYEVLRSEIVHLLAMLVRTTHKERKNMSGLSPDRADIIIPGVVLVDRLMKHLGTNVLRINERGIREGLVLKSLGKYHPVAGNGHNRDWRSSVEDLARSCQVDMVHSRQVTRLALGIFDSLSDNNTGMDEKARILLEAASLLHDIGYFINYSQHHKHSYHLIRHARLFDFSPRDREVIANVARYHRRALPKMGHSNFRDLSKDDQDLVRKLGAILRLADGLDRRRNARITGLRCQVKKGAFAVAIEGQGDMSVEIHWATTKGEMFRKVFGLSLSVSGPQTINGSDDRSGKGMISDPGGAAT